MVLVTLEFKKLSMTKNTSVIVTNDSSLILDSDGLILPGVGAFSEIMKNFKKYNLKPVIDEYLDKGKPLGNLSWYANVI